MTRSTTPKRIGLTSLTLALAVNALTYGLHVYATTQLAHAHAALTASGPNGSEALAHLDAVLEREHDTLTHLATLLEQRIKHAQRQQRAWLELHDDLLAARDAHPECYATRD